MPKITRHGGPSDIDAGAAVVDADQTTLDEAEDTAEEGDEFDPADWTVNEVNAHLDTADEFEVERVLAAERAGRARAGILNRT